MVALFEGLIGLLVFALGAAIGSFVNVVVYRLPAGLSLVHPPSRCPRCGTRLAPKDNIPVLGWLWLKGRCRYCRSPISPRYPIVETLTGTLFLLAFWQFGYSWQTLGCWVLASWLLALSLIDFDTLTLPNPLTQSGLVAGLLFQATQGMAATGHWQLAASALMNGVIGAVVGIWLLDGIALIGSWLLGQAAMGAGDAKLAAMLGAWLGWQPLLLAGFLACALGVVVGGGAIALGWLDRRQPIPFGPFLALGALITFFWGSLLITTYQQWFLG
jgi:leader peptidase (prepilin peptidase)/N-methyltransferase